MSASVAALVVHQRMASSEEGRPVVRSGSSVMDMPLGRSAVEEMHRIELNEMASYGAHRGH